MGFNDYILDKLFVCEEICPKCGKTLECTYEEQEPGFRFKDTKRCPYCGAELDESMQYEFTIRKVEK